MDSQWYTAFRLHNCHNNAYTSNVTVWSMTHTAKLTERPLVTQAVVLATRPQEVRRSRYTLMLYGDDHQSVAITRMQQAVLCWVTTITGMQLADSTPRSKNRMNNNSIQTVVETNLRYRDSCLTCSSAVERCSPVVATEAPAGPPPVPFGEGHPDRGSQLPSDLQSTSAAAAASATPPSAPAPSTDVDRGTAECGQRKTAVARAARSVRRHWCPHRGRPEAEVGHRRKTWSRRATYCRSDCLRSK